MKNTELRQERLQELLRYDPGAGKFRWRVPRRQGGRAGDIAGCRMRWDYWCIYLDGHSYRAHRASLRRR